MKSLEVLDHDKLTTKGQEIVLRLLAGKTYGEILKEVECSKGTISYYSKKLNINRQVKEKIYSKEECKEAILSFYKETGKIPSKEDFYGLKINSYHIKKVFSSWNSAIEFSGLHSRNNIYNNEKLLEFIKSFYIAENRVPQARDFISNSNYPSSATYQDRFGSWNKAVELAGFSPNINDGYGNRTVAKDGILYRSQAEAHFVNNYLLDSYDFEYEKKYGNGWLFDFYLPEHNLYIELDGGLRPQRIEEKIEFCKVNNIKLLVITKEEVYKKDFALVV